MNFPVLENSDPKPVALTLDQYAEFVWCFLKSADYKRLCDQKAREEIVESPFSLPASENSDE